MFASPTTNQDVTCLWLWRGPSNKLALLIIQRAAIPIERRQANYKKQYEARGGQITGQQVDSEEYRGGDYALPGGQSTHPGDN